METVAGVTATTFKSGVPQASIAVYIATSAIGGILDSRRTPSRYFDFERLRLCTKDRWFDQGSKVKVKGEHEHWSILSHIFYHIHFTISQMKTLSLISFFRNFNFPVHLRKDMEAASARIPSSACYGLVYRFASFLLLRVDGELDRLRVLIYTERRLNSNFELAVLLHESG